MLFANFHRTNWVLQITTAVRLRSWPGIMKWPPTLIPRTCVESFSKLYLYFCVRKFRINANFMVSNLDLLVMVILINCPIVLRRIISGTTIPANSNFLFCLRKKMKVIKIPQQSPIFQKRMLRNVLFLPIINSLY